MSDLRERLEALAAKWRKMTEPPYHGGTANQMLSMCARELEAALAATSDPEEAPDERLEHHPDCAATTFTGLSVSQPPSARYIHYANPCEREDCRAMRAELDEVCAARLATNPFHNLTGIPGHVYDRSHQAESYGGIARDREPEEAPMDPSVYNDFCHECGTKYNKYAAEDCQYLGGFKKEKRS